MDLVVDLNIDGDGDLNVGGHTLTRLSGLAQEWRVNVYPSLFTSPSPSMSKSTPQTTTRSTWTLRTWEVGQRKRPTIATVPDLPTA